MNYVRRIVQRQQQEYHNKTFVNFKKEAVISKLSKNDLMDKLDFLIDSKYTFIKHTTFRNKFKSKTYTLTYDDHLIKLAYFDGKKYYFCTTNYHDDLKNIETPNSFKVFRKLFRERTGMRLPQAFGKTPQSFKLYCPRPLYYINQSYDKGVWFDNVCKEDYNSHYPWSSTGLLPDANTILDVEGYIKPSKEYPFAFYPDSGNVAVYNEFDSHEWINYVKVYSANIRKIKYDPDYRKTDEHTILMKASKYSLAEEIIHFYNIKCHSMPDSDEYHNAKMFLLKFIGMMEQCNSKIYMSYPFAHIAAVIKWRANIKMFKTIKEIGSKNVIQICVDGIIHKGDPIGTTDNSIGSLSYEFVNSRFIHRGINQYILRNSTQEEKKHAGLDVNTDSDSIMIWMASPKVDFITYIKNNYLIEELKHEKKIH